MVVNKYYMQMSELADDVSVSPWLFAVLLTYLENVKLW